MKKQIKLIIIATISFMLLYVYATNYVLRFSIPSGFYEYDFLLNITAPSNKIYYTLDGSTPTKDSILYTEPILITDASLNENVYSLREDLSTFLLEDLIIKYNDDENYSSIYKIPDYLIDKCTIIRATYYDIFDVAQEITTATYFVNYHEKTGYDTKYTASIITDPDNLFDSEIGIYVLGDTFENYVESVDINGIYYAGWETNYWNKGREWERDANILLFNQDKDLILNKQVGVRIQGGYSRSHNVKSLNIYSRPEYDKTKIIEYPIWEGSSYQPDVFTIASGGNDIYTKLRDRLVSELSQDLDVALIKYEPCTLFLNGEYWGVFHIAEKYTRDYFQHYYGVDPDKVVVIKGGYLEEGTEENFQEFNEMYEFLENEDLDFTIAENYDYLWTMMDKSSTIDHFALMLYFGRTSDWIPMIANSAIWKTDYISGNTYENGKWRWAIYDMNWGAMHSNFNNKDSIADIRSRIGWFDKLCENDDFVNLLTNRLFELLQNDYQEEISFNIIDSYIIEMEKAMEKHYLRFFAADLTRFYEQIEEIKAFFNGRNENMKSFIYENFGITENK